MTEDETMNPNPSINGASLQDWSDFAYTANLLLDLAVARHRRAAAPAKPAPVILPAREFRFVRMAAATGVPPLPTQKKGLSDTSRTLGLWVAPQGENGLRLFLQARGLPAINGLSNRWATISSDNGAIYLSLRFDRKGRAECDLADDAEIRAALLSPLSVHVPGLNFDFGAAESDDDDSE